LSVQPAALAGDGVGDVAGAAGAVGAGVRGVRGDIGLGGGTGLDSVVFGDVGGDLGSDEAPGTVKVAE
jgi:hypothetical protein